MNSLTWDKIWPVQCGGNSSAKVEYIDRDDTDRENDKPGMLPIYLSLTAIPSLSMPTEVMQKNPILCHMLDCLCVTTDISSSYKQSDYEKIY